MKRAEDGLYLITPDCADTAALLARLVPVLATGGVALLQYRSKVLHGDARAAQAQAVAARCAEAGVPLIVNDDVALAHALGAAGVHLGRDDGDPREARARLGPDAIIGVSCYDEWARAEAAVAVGADYVAFGAIYPSLTKPAAVRAPLSLLTRAAVGLPARVAAIGGITVARAAEVRAAGAHYVCVVSDVFGAADPVERVRAYQRVLRRAPE